MNNLNAPKHGTVIPNRIFVGGISPSTTEVDLVHLFSSYGNVTGTKIISDRAVVSKGYVFVTFETEEEAKRLQKDVMVLILFVHLVFLFIIISSNIGFCSGGQHFFRSKTT